MKNLILKWGHEINVDETLKKLDLMKKLDWQHLKWEPTLTLLNKKNGIRTYRLKSIPIEKHFEVVGTSDHSHCEICWTSISSILDVKTTSESSSDKIQKTVFAYLPTSQNTEIGWTCIDCYEKLVLAVHPKSIMLDNRRKYKS